jgi:hypothetical protein
MSVAETDRVDAVGIEKETGRIVLTIIDPFEWDDSHVLLLQEKLNAYLRFVESGQLLSEYPSATGRQVAISLLMQFEPNHLGRAFLSRAAEAIEGAGITLHWQLVRVPS